MLQNFTFKKTSYVFVLALFTFLVFNTQKSQAQFRYGGSISMALPVGDWSDIASFGVGIQGDLVYDISDEFFLHGSLGYNHFFTEDNEFIDASYSIIPFLVSANYSFDGPYISGGLGIYSVRATVSTPGISFFGISAPPVETTVTETEIGFNIGAGYMVNKLNIGLKYHLVPDASYLGLSVGLLFGGE